MLNEKKKTSSNILVDPSNALGLLRAILLSWTMGKGGGILDYASFWAPREIKLDQSGTCKSRPCILQYKSTIKPLGHILRIFLFGEVPLWGPRGSRMDQNCTCTTRPWGYQIETLNRSLQYLIMEELEEEDTVYGWTDRQPADRVLHKLDWCLTSRSNKNSNAST